MSPALLATIRVIQCADDEIPQVENAFYGRMISVRNEMASYESLLKLIIARMDVTKAQVQQPSAGRQRTHSPLCLLLLLFYSIQQ